MRFDTWFDTDWVNEEIKQCVWFQWEEREAQGLDVFIAEWTAHMCLPGGC